MSLLDPFWIVLCLFAIAVVVAGVFAYKLYRQGVPRDQIAGQTGLKAVGLADSVADRVLAALAAEATKLNLARGLRDNYFDADELIADLARLPEGGRFTATVRLDGLVKRQGSIEVVDYVTDPVTKNVRKA